MWRSVLFYALICTSAVLSWTQERLAVQSGPVVIPAFDQIKGLSNTIAKADYERSHPRHESSSGYSAITVLCAWAGGLGVRLPIS
jgi:hypothetical protein